MAENTGIVGDLRGNKGSTVRSIRKELEEINMGVAIREGEEREEVGILYLHSIKSFLSFRPGEKEVLRSKFPLAGGEAEDTSRGREAFSGVLGECGAKVQQHPQGEGGARVQRTQGEGCQACSP